MLAKKKKKKTMAPTTGHRIISATTVRPLDAEHHGGELSRKIELTPCDLELLFVDHIQKGLLFPKPKQPGNFVEHLKATLSRALSIFYPLAGRLVRVENCDDTVSFFVHCNSAGAMFVHAIADGLSVADVLEPVNIPGDVVYSFFPMNGATNVEGVSKPLLAVQVTELVDGVFVALNINHTVSDGMSFWKFFNTWSRISREEDGHADNSHVTPVVGLNYLEGIVDLPIRIPSSLTKITKNVRINPPLQQRMFRFSKEKISELKAQANAEMSTDKISSLQALMANLWVSITRNRRLKVDEEVSYGVVVDLRSRLQPPLPEEYLGNAVILSNVKATAGELLERGVGWAAWEINKMMASWTVAEVRKSLQERAISPVIKKKGSNPPNFLLTVSSPQFDVHGNDFGWGKPLAVRSGPGNKRDGKLTVFEGAEEGSIDFEVCLCAETFEAMAHDEELLRILATPMVPASCV